MSLLKQATISCIKFVTKIAWRLELRHERIGNLYDVPGAGKYAIFRETVSRSSGVNERPAVLVFGFRLKLIGANAFLHWLFQRVCILTTPFWSGFSGFHTKLWMVDPQTKNYLGIYQWLGTDNAQAYIDFLTPVLKFFSVKNSTWHRLYPATRLEPFLAEIKAVNAESQPAFDNLET